MSTIEEIMEKARNEEFTVLKGCIVGTPLLKTELEFITGESLPEFFCIKEDLSGVMYQGIGKIEWLKIGSVDLLRTILKYEEKTGNTVPLIKTTDRV